MDRKRPADVAIKPDPDAKRVKREGGDHFDMYSLPTGPPAAASTSASVVPKVEHGGDGYDRKPLGPAPSFGGASKKDKKRRFFSSGPKVIIVRRGKDDTVRAHFNRTGMFVELDIYRSHDAFWNPIDAEKEVFQRLSKAHMDIEPVEPYGFISRWLKQHGQVLGLPGSNSVQQSNTAFNSSGKVVIDVGGISCRRTDDALEFKYCVDVQTKRQVAETQVGKENARANPHETMTKENSNTKAEQDHKKVLVAEQQTRIDRI